MTGRWPLTGRLAEVERLDAMLADSDRTGVVLAGPSGVGKTRLGIECLEATGGRDLEDGLRHATWRTDSGGEVDAGVMLRAAERARQLWDLALVERLALTAAEQGAGFGARLLLGQLAVLQGRPQEAEDILSLLVDAAADDAQRATVANLRINNL